MPRPLDALSDDPLAHLALGGEVEAFKAAFADRGADPNARYAPSECTLLHFAVSGDDEANALEIVRHLLSEGADATILDAFFGKTCFHLAAEKAYHDVLNLLVSRNIPIDVADAYGFSAIDNLIRMRANAPTVAWLAMRMARPARSISDAPDGDRRPFLEAQHRLPISFPGASCPDLAVDRRLSFQEIQRAQDQDASDDVVMLDLGGKKLSAPRSLLIRHSALFADALWHPLDPATPRAIAEVEASAFDELVRILQYLSEGAGAPSRASIVPALGTENDIAPLLRVWSEATALEMHGLASHITRDKLLPALAVCLKWTQDGDPSGHIAQVLWFLFRAFCYCTQVQGGRAFARFAAAILLNNIVAVCYLCCYTWSDEQVAYFVELLYDSVLKLSYATRAIGPPERLLGDAWARLATVLPPLEQDERVTEALEQIFARSHKAAPGGDHGRRRRPAFLDAVARRLLQVFCALKGIFHATGSPADDDLAAARTPERGDSEVSLLSVTASEGAPQTLQTLYHPVTRSPIIDVVTPVKYLWRGRTTLRFGTSTWAATGDADTKFSTFCYDWVRDIRIKADKAVLIDLGDHVECYMPSQPQDCQRIADIINERRGLPGLLVSWVD